MRFRLPTLFSENFRGPPTNFGKSAGNLGKLENLQRTFQKSGTYPGNLRGDLRGASGEPPGTSGEPPGNLRGPPGTSGNLRGPPGNLRGPPGNLRGTFRGPPGNLRGNLRGPPGNLRGTSGDLRGPPGKTSGDLWGQLPGHFWGASAIFLSKITNSTKICKLAAECGFLRFSRFLRFSLFFVTLRFFFRLLCGSTRSLCLAFLFKCLALEHRSSHSSGYQGRER